MCSVDGFSGIFGVQLVEGLWAQHRGPVRFVNEVTSERRTKGSVLLELEQRDRTRSRVT